MRTRVSQRLNEGGAPVFYPAAEIDAALNEANRFFVLLTLGLEATQTWNVAPNTTFFRMVSVFSDWIVPLRITDSTGAKVRPARLDELTALNPSWIASPGAPTRYVAVGGDFVGLYGQPSAGGTALSVTYARAPVALVNDGDVPEVPGEYHPKYVDYGIYRCRQVEGGQEFQKSLKYFASFLEGATHYAAYVRARNIGGRYDTVPFELESFDRSKLLGLRPDPTQGTLTEVAGGPGERGK
jgi:hypothetical protein